MDNVVELRPRRPARPETEHPVDGGMAEILFFTGIRRERHDEDGRRDTRPPAPKRRVRRGA